VKTEGPRHGLRAAGPVRRRRSIRTPVQNCRRRAGRPVKRSTGSHQLRQHRLAVPFLGNHPLQPPDLALYALQTIGDLLRSHPSTCSWIPRPGTRWILACFAGFVKPRFTFVPTAGAMLYGRIPHRPGTDACSLPAQSPVRQANYRGLATAGTAKRGRERLSVGRAVQEGGWLFSSMRRSVPCSRRRMLGRWA
jgi:hypothetical protein